MPRSRSPSPSLSHFLAIEVVSSGQSVFVAIHALRRSRIADCIR